MYKQKGMNFGEGTRSVDSPAGAGAGQGYLDNQAKLKRENPGPTPDYSNYGSLGEIERAQRKGQNRNTEASMPAVNVGGTGNFNDSDHGADLGNYHEPKAKDITKKAAGIKGSFGGGALSRRQQKRLEKGGAKAERQLARIEKKRDRKRRRAERRGTDWRV